MSLKNLKIGTRIMLGFFVILSIFMAMTVVLTLSLNKVIYNSQFVKNESLPFTLTADEMNISITEVQQWLTDVSATHNRDGYNDADDAVKVFKSGLEKFRAMFREENDTKMLHNMDKLEEAFDNLYDVGKKMAESYIKEGIEAGNVIMGDFDGASEELKDRMTALQKTQVEEAYEFSNNTVSMSEDVRKVLWTLTGVAILIGIIIAIYITRTISIPLKNFTFVVDNISKGDLTDNVDINSKDEIGAMESAVKHMLEKLNTIVADIRRASENVASGSNELSSTSQTVAQGSTEQAASAEEASASMEQMSSNIRQTTDNSQQTEKIAGKAADDAKVGGQAVSDAMEAMKQIADKISIIEDIARQTNLLALNAAIEHRFSQQIKAS